MTCRSQSSKRIDAKREWSVGISVSSRKIAPKFIGLAPEAIVLENEQAHEFGLEGGAGDITDHEGRPGDPLRYAKAGMTGAAARHPVSWNSKPC